MSVGDAEAAARQSNATDPPAYADRSGGIGEISGTGNTSFASTHGPIHTGPGPQYNGPVNIGLDPIVESARRMALRRLVSVDELDWLAARFVQPPTRGYRRIQEKLHLPGIVAISGHPGSGRRAAALMLLHKSGDGTTRFQQLSVQDDTTFDPPAHTILDGERLLLDLSAFTPERLRAIETHLSSYRAEVERRAYLVVVLPHRHEDVLSDVFHSDVVEIERPDWREVVERHLGKEGIEVPADDLAVLGAGVAAWPMRNAT